MENRQYRHRDLEGLVRSKKNSRKNNIIQSVDPVIDDLAFRISKNPNRKLHVFDKEYIRKAIIDDINKDELKLLLNEINNRGFTCFSYDHSIIIFKDRLDKTTYEKEKEKYIKAQQRICKFLIISLIVFVCLYLIILLYFLN